jgi:hypothetical protein
MTTSNLLRRVQRLEGGCAEKRWPVMVWMMAHVESSRRQTLGIHERIVADWYRDFNGIVWARERVTTDAEDVGLRCEPGGFLPGVIQELHANCEFRDRGPCTICARLDRDHARSQTCLVES